MTLVGSTLTHSPRPTLGNTTVPSISMSTKLDTLQTEYSPMLPSLLSAHAKVPFGRRSSGPWHDSRRRRATLVLFVGFALMTGELAGSVYHRYANVSQIACLLVSVGFLWMAQSSNEEYEYNLTDCRFVSRFRVSFYVLNISAGNGVDTFKIPVYDCYYCLPSLQELKG
ncbi:hypothetical protein K435DRAFT_797463 [Dendrothele bispora CBS 962.96]|uniref:Uncharacterized protein n=1 Tax=Dendrothele bispora (strain CBS 962.96) TaxID=1314807 RepID=A0A4S8M2A3_DENBC|nr:hypothetical protein K435DRAFT_797463 [Dendrothele bispora CBS 962.96]